MGCAPDEYDDLISGTCSHLPYIPDTDTRRVMYMEGCDMLSKETMNEIRNTVKSPTDNMKIHRNGNHVTKIEFMEERNEITL
ncbi:MULTISPECIES: hypothetical protein [Enterobacter cloacae complex]|uniref:hypothetical protein n=1 Tax=Enterobacter cloacae complex TaxID=354276 RepID=UPI001EEB95DE|nr:MULTISPECIES: hypothetical protein [Enterobacter cloacae complex]MDX7038227.1 hypothetical protein [Enterobacter roggenkampii]